MENFGLCLYLRSRGCHEFFVTRSAFLLEPRAYGRHSPKLASLKHWLGAVASAASPCESASYRHCKIVSVSAAKLQKTGDLYTYKTKDIMLSEAGFFISINAVCLISPDSRIAY